MMHSSPPFTGLSADQVLASRQQHGTNLLTPPQRDPWWKLYLEKFQDPVIRILLIAAVIAIVAGAYHGEYIEGVGILLAILLSTALAFWNEFRANREFDLLNKVEDEVPVKTMRDGSVTPIPKRDVVVGDIVLLELGEEVPADGTLREAVNLQIDESRLTGESVPATKSIQHADAPEEAAYAPDRVFRGTLVADGRGVVEVTAVGDHTELGQTARAASEETHAPTPLSRQLTRLSQLIGVLGLGFAIFTFFGLLGAAWWTGRLALSPPQWAFVFLLISSVFLALIRVWLPMLYDGLGLLGLTQKTPAWLEASSMLGWMTTVFAGALLFALGLGLFILTGYLSLDSGTWLAHDAGELLLRYFMVSVTIIVVAVPEGLAMSVTLALAYSMRRMAATNNLVRRMHACETIGAATVICTDKTGTLTMNRMRLHAAHFPALGSLPRSTQKTDDPLPPALALVAEALAVNSTAHLSRDGDSVAPVGNPTEAATLLWLQERHIDYAAWRQRFRTQRQWTFSTERKFMGTLGQAPGMGGSILHVKGAPEIVLSRCIHQLTPQGAQPLEENQHKQIEQQLKEYQQRGMRTLGLAFHDHLGSFTPTDVQEKDDLPALAQGLTWLGFIVIHDPIRPEAAPALASCARAGVAVKMVTGDNPATAREIARQVHLWNEQDDGHKFRLLTGPDFEALDDQAAHQAVQELKVLARARPLDKLRLVRLLKDQGHVVAVTGDGTNDAPAMNYADVGLAMGKTGTAVAKEASDIILLDDSFTSIVNAILWGRSLYQNIQRFLLFQLTINLSALTLALIAAFTTAGSTPLTVMQLLWVNLIMDTFAALALATEPPEPRVMHRPPRHPGDFIITPKMTWGIVGMAALFVVLLGGLLWWFQAQGPFDYSTAQEVLHSSTATASARLSAQVTLQRLSFFFTFYVMLQFWNLFNARRMGSSRSVFYRPFRNLYFWLIAVAILVGQFLITQFGGIVFSTYPLTWQQWGIILAASSGVLVLGEAYRFLKRLKKL
jgi:Ca2+-transporting ATPase